MNSYVTAEDVSLLLPNCTPALFFFFSISITVILKIILLFLYDISRSFGSQCLPACPFIASSPSTGHTLPSCRPQASINILHTEVIADLEVREMNSSLSRTFLHSTFHFKFNFCHLFHSLLSKKGDCIDTGHLCI